jgi:hypothetical protein
MKKLATAIIFALALHVAHASPVTYQINFVATSGPAPDSGSFTYDPAVGFTSFVVNWLGDSLTPPPTPSGGEVGFPPEPGVGPNDPVLNGVGCNNEASTPAFGFIIMSQSATGCSATYRWDAGKNEGDGGISVITFDLFTPANSFPDVIEATKDGTFGQVSSASGTWSITAIPEPGPSVLALSGILILWFRRAQK